MNDEIQIARLTDAHVVMSPEEKKAYLNMSDVLEKPPTVLPKGYKRCTKCKVVKKLYMFNKNSQAKDNCTCQCKECQKGTAKKSYTANKHKRTYKKYYQEHKEEKQARSRQYYQEHKEALKVKHAEYRQTKAGKKAMIKAHSKRNQSIKNNAGIPYKREMVIDRDKRGGIEPICYLCEKGITGALHLDHIIPIVMGGKDCFTNVACVHESCNLRKSKDAREITTAQVEFINKLSEEYMENHKELFPDIFGEPNKETDTE